MDQNARRDRIGFFPHRPSGCYWYRIKQPMDMLNANGVKAVEMRIGEDVDCIDSFRSFQLYGATPFSMRKVFDYMIETGKKMVYDTDDALTLIDLSNPFYHAVKRDVGSFIEALERSDHITVSTPAMAKYASSLTNKPVTVVPNCFTPSEWTYPRPEREGFRVGFAGSATHVQDLIDVIPAIRNLQIRYPGRLKFLIMGFGQSDYRKWHADFRYGAPDEAVALLDQFDRLLAGIEFEWVPYVDFKDYPSTLINMALDIGLCPLRDTPFNRCRSACKAMEYALSGALALATDCDVYRSELSSILVEDGKWEEKIEFYMNDRATLDSDRSKRLEWIKENRDIGTQLAILRDIYEV